MSHSRPVALRVADVPPREKLTNYPEPFASRMKGRDKRPLGDRFGLTSFGVNLTRLNARRPVGAASRPHACRTSSSIFSKAARRW